MRKKQTAVSHSSTEAEIIALETLLRAEALPVLSFWSIILDLYGLPAVKGSHSLQGTGRPVQETAGSDVKPIEKRACSLWKTMRR